MLLEDTGLTALKVRHAIFNQTEVFVLHERNSVNCKGADRPSSNRDATHCKCFQKCLEISTILFAENLAF